ncbi:nitrate- and nitrite sensing domain-containing protein [Streptomyces sp. ST2-7A]|uniref:sensor histidine kinase n=1 Tax=Streptomyces sp. ST2-7A TaxID=2907214 RepID=UPI001F17B886|nr:nitrate- and nitrite sensing domain-containing protein [Streptomyces sp. ST2-7A]MCE7079368.1 nitrate- and nitrite sensing domain-containing protein [Streptomyces sp. ST2-7A]
MRFRGGSIRHKVVVLLLVPLLSLVSLWGFATALTVHEARQLARASHLVEDFGDPAVDVVRDLRRERRETIVHLADPRGPREQLRGAREATDRSVDIVRTNASGPARGNLAPGAAEALDGFLEALEHLERAREQVDTNTLTRTGALDAYNAVAEPGLRLGSALHLLENVELDRHGRAVASLGMVAENVSRIDALVAGALAAGHMTDREHRALSDAVAERGLLHRLHRSDLPVEDRRARENFWQAGQGRILRETEELVVEQGVGGTQPGRWEEITAGTLEELRSLDDSAAERYAAEMKPAADSVLLRAALAGVAGLVAVLLSIGISLRMGRDLTRELRVLSDRATESAEVRLPSVMNRIAAGDRVDPTAGAPGPGPGPGSDETGRVERALDTLERAAIEAALRRAEMRHGISEVFVNLARRNQGLSQKQLNIIGAMRRRTDDEDELEELFRLDNLANRMRRHAEGLMILSGAPPTRQWRRSVRLMDVVRCAVREVGDSERVEVRRMPSLAVDGAAVADLVHLMAELLENAINYSPPHTAVQVHGERVPHGFSVEIHDRGLGMPPEAMSDANHRLADAPDFELSDTDRLGLFVVARLARRHGVRVSLRESPYGGTTAVVLVPGELLGEWEGEEEGTPRVGGVDRLPVNGRPATASVEARRGGPVELEAPAERVPAGHHRAADRARAGDLVESLAGRSAGGSAGPRPPLPTRRPGRAVESSRRGPRDTGNRRVGRAERSGGPGPEGRGGSRRGPDPEHAATEGGEAPLPPRRRPPVLIAENGRVLGEPPASFAERGGEGDDRPGRARDARPEPGEGAVPGGGHRGEGSGDPAAPEPADPASGPAGPERPLGARTPGVGAERTDPVPIDRPPRTGSRSGGGLPRRVPRIRPAGTESSRARPVDGPDPGARAGDPAGEDPSTDGSVERDAEAARVRMSALQAGWRRGRREREPGSGEPARGETAPPKHHEGQER